MKKLGILFFSLLGILLMESCNDGKTYAEQLEEEREMIKKFMSQHDINIISMDKFRAQDSVTYENEYVEFSGEGVYMHVTHQAAGDDARFAETNDLVLVRFMEVNLSTGDTISSYTNNGYPPDEFRYTKGTSTILGQFVGGGLMQTIYGQSVPAGWLMPLNYLRLSDNSGSDRTEINVIVSAKNGQADAIQYVYPCFYKLTFQFPK